MTYKEVQKVESGGSRDESHMGTCINHGGVSMIPKEVQSTQKVIQVSPIKKQTTRQEAHLIHMSRASGDDTRIMQIYHVSMQMSHIYRNTKSPELILIGYMRNEDELQNKKSSAKRFQRSHDIIRLVIVVSPVVVSAISSSPVTKTMYIGLVRCTAICVGKENF
jgi:hypothetical protein